MNALKYYGKAYSLLKADYRKCHLKPNDWRLKKVMLQLPFFMSAANHDHQSIDKAKVNLKVWLEKYFLKLKTG